MPFARLQDFFKKVCHLSIGKGTLENIICRTAQKAEPPYQQIKKTILVSFFVGSDETSFKAKGNKHWFWVWQTALVTYIVTATSRAKQVISDCFPDGLPNSILCSDRLAAFRRIIEGRNVFQGYDAAELIDQANALFTEAGSSQRLIDAAVSVIAAHNRLPLFLHCLEVILADGVVTPREHKILHYLKGKLGEVSPLAGYGKAALPRTFLLQFITLNSLSRCQIPPAPYQQNRHAPKRNKHPDVLHHIFVAVVGEENDIGQSVKKSAGQQAAP